MEIDKKPNCFKCVHKRNIEGYLEIRCNNNEAKVRGDEVGITNGFFDWPGNFHAMWLLECDGFKKEDKDTAV